MNVFDEVRSFCLSLNYVTESFPFDESTLVFKVGGKMFALIDIEDANSINLKCDPEKAIDLRERFHYVLPGYHMNKNHWNTVLFDTSLSSSFLQEMIIHSYQLVWDKLPKKVRLELTTSV